MFEICYSDLTPEAQKRFLEYIGMKDPKEGNYDAGFPITIIDYPREDSEN